MRIRETPDSEMREIYAPDDTEVSEESLPHFEPNSAMRESNLPMRIEDYGRRPSERSPDEIREGVRAGILDALVVEIDRASSATAGRLVVAGVLGLAGAVGAVLLFSGNSLRSSHGFHLAFCAAVWSGLLVECFALVLLRIRSRRLPLSQAGALALLGLALAALLGLICPEPRYLNWWASTALGGTFVKQTGISGGALCLGFSSSVFIGVTASLLLTIRGIRFRSIHLPAILLFLLLWPAVILQSAEHTVSTFAYWSFGLAVGAYVGVFMGLLPARMSRQNFEDAEAA